MNENDDSFQNLLTAMKELGISGDPYEIGEEYGIFDEPIVPRVMYNVNYPVLPFLFKRAKSVDEIKDMLKIRKNDKYLKY